MEKDNLMQNLLFSSIFLLVIHYNLQHEILFAGDCFGTRRERTKRSDTSKRHILARQKQIDSSETHNNISKASFLEMRR